MLPLWGRGCYLASLTATASLAFLTDLGGQAHSSIPSLQVACGVEGLMSQNNGGHQRQQVAGPSPQGWGQVLVVIVTLTTQDLHTMATHHLGGGYHCLYDSLCSLCPLIRNNFGHEGSGMLPSGTEGIIPALQSGHLSPDGVSQGRLPFCTHA